jgi:hypothetical protein
MGRQIQIASLESDNKLFEEFLKARYDCVFVDVFAPTKELLFKERLESRFKYASWYIWNKDFDWQPEFGQVGENAVNKDMAGYYYISNRNDAPLIEFTKSNLDEKRYGRIYWSKGFSAPNGLKYDVLRFTKFYEQVSRWIIKEATGKVKSSNVNTYFLPDAWKQFGKLNKNVG